MGWIHGERGHIWATFKRHQDTLTFEEPHLAADEAT